ncbi:MAG: type II CRISPR-associated endonuclease Cas1 [Propionibacteriaceae bacterium]|jgi:CRISPR-associated protein Cas1|nr:type II CRISPR-associated endonuclease Cas1 [Propionibacteriaceae bacterium]
MAAWRTLDLTGFDGRLSYQRGQAVVSDASGARTTVPLADVALMLVGLKVKLGGAFLQQCAAFDVVVLLCDRRGVPVSGSYPWSSHTRVGARQLAQVALSAPRQKNAWGRIVRAKVQGQQANLRALGRPGAKTLAEVARSIRSGDPDNAKARAAKAYWPQVFGQRFSRLPGEGGGKNALLDYGYTVMRGFAIRAVLEAGLTPALGLFHRGRSNPFNLADDLIEPFRPAVDWCVAHLPDDASSDHPAVKQALVRASSDPFTSAGYSASTELRNLAQALGNYVEGEVSRLQVPVWEPTASQSRG